MVKTWTSHKTTEGLFNTGGRLTTIGGWWRLAVGGWWRLAVGGWWRLAVVGGWRLVVDGSERLRWAVGAGRWLAVGGWGLSLRAVLNQNKKEFFRTSLWSLQLVRVAQLSLF